MNSTSARDISKIRWRIFAVSTAASALTILDISKINVALPSLSDHLEAGPGLLQLLVAGYTLALGLTLIPSGRYGDLSSRRNMFLVGVTMFMLSSLLCAISPNIEILVVGRLLQGVAGGLLMPQVLGIIQQLFRGRERGIALGTFGAVIGLSTAFGPAIGGILLEMGDAENSWRYIFWMNVPLALIIIAIAIFILPTTQEKPAIKLQMDMFGTFILAAAIFSLMMPFVLTTGTEHDDPARWWWLVPFVVLTGLFVYWEIEYEKRGKSPVINFSLFKFSSFRNGTIIGFFYFGAMPPIFLLATLFLQDGVHLSPLMAGIVSMPFALLSALTSWQSGKLVYRMGRNLVIIGIFMVAIGLMMVLAAVYFVDPEYVLWAMMIGMGVGGLGSGLVISPNQTLMLDDVPIAEGGLAGSIGQVGQRIGTAIGIALTVSTFYSTITLPGGKAPQLHDFQLAVVYSFMILLGFLSITLIFSFWDMIAGKKPIEKARPRS